MIRMGRREQPLETEQPASKQVPAQRRGPEGIATVEAPRKADELLKAGVTERDLLDPEAPSLYSGGAPEGGLSGIGTRGCDGGRGLSAREVYARLAPS